VTELPSLSLIQIPRFVGTQSGSTYTLCGFCDASARGYAALVYLRIVLPNNQAFIRILCGKTKLAPLHSMTVPRLELCGAGLLARWLSRIQETLSAQLKISNVYAWTDSFFRGLPPHTYRTRSLYPTELAKLISYYRIVSGCMCRPRKIQQTARLAV